MSEALGYSFWLLPQAEPDAWFGQCVARLAPRFGCPVFRPHMTVQGDLALPAHLLQAALAELAGVVRPLVFEVNGVHRSAEYFRSLYLAFETLPAFDRLQQLAAEQSGTAQGLSPFPHVSLAYGESADPQTKEAVMHEIGPSAGFSGKVGFDRLALVHSAKWVPIEQWRVLQTVGLCC